VISVLIADDQDLVREGLRMMLEAEPDLRVAGEAGNGHQALTQTRRPEVAAKLYLSEATVKSHVAHVLAKLNLRDRVQIAVFAYENGIVRPGRG
jgi:DNA-binding NarL/FixJ family response regulator